MANNPTPTLSRQEMAANYGWSYAFLKSNPELWKLFNTAVKKNYSQARFVAALRETKWYQKNSDTARQTQILQKTDPATYNQRLAAMQDKIAQQAGQAGSVFSQRQLHDIAQQAMMFGWDDNMITKILSEHVQTQKGGRYGGAAGQAQQELNQYAYQMGVTLSDPTLKTWLSNIVGQTHTIDDYKGFIQQQAMNTFPSLTKELAGGQTLSQIADPYVQQMAQTLELNPTELNVFTPQIRQALQGVRQQDGSVVATPLYQFEQQIKSDPALGWTKTDNGRAALSAASSQVLKDMGFHY